jgi:phosphoribosylglycinamide formyltransferase-1
MKRIGILLSGRGSNFLAIARAIAEERLRGAEIAVVVSNLADAPGLAAAKELGIPAFAVEAQGRKRVQHDAAIISVLREHGVELVCLAGYMRLVSAEFVHAFPNRILNIHPSLLPSFPGLHGQMDALEAGVKVSGCTVHFVDEQLDHGVIILQRAVVVLDSDNEHTLAERILEQEHIAYPEAIARVLSGEYEIEGQRYILRG